MPSTPEAIEHFLNQNLFSPGKASNAEECFFRFGNVQNSLRMSWSSEEVDQKLKQIMKSIHESCVQYGKDGDFVDYVKANIAGFVKVADAMIDQGVV